MTTHPALTPPEQTQALALDIHALLRDFDPTHWRDAQQEQLRQRVEALKARLTQALELKVAQKDALDQEVRGHVLRMQDVFQAHWPSPHDDSEEHAGAWERLRNQAIPVYEEFAASLKQAGIGVPSFRHTRPTNYLRNVFHVGIALACIALVYVLPQMTSLGFWSVTIIAGSFALSGWTLELARRRSAWVNAQCMKVFRHVSHPHEVHHVNSSTWYTSALFLISLTHSPMLCAAALGVLGVGDPAAAIIGKRFGRVRLANGRSLEGAAAFILIGGLLTAGLLIALHPEIATWKLAAVAASAATAGALTELWIERIDDNLAIPVSAVLAAAAVAWGTGLM